MNALQEICDRCPQPAVKRVKLTNGYDLLACNHHWHEWSGQLNVTQVTELESVNAKV